eukprot:10696304-Prorocentrum_lima.AAC.1
MTSSLVGSEMCIRDRANEQRRGQEARTERRVGQRPSGHDGRHGHDPVSYTHLTLPTICSV